MADTIQGAVSVSAIGTGAEFRHMIGTNDKDSLENDVEIDYQTAGILKLFTIVAWSNSVNATRTYQLRKNNTDANQSVSVTASTTGFFEDTSNTDTVSAGDDFALSIPAGGSSGTTSVDISLIFDATSNTVSKWTTTSGQEFFSGAEYAGASTTYRNVVNGFQENDRTTTGGEDIIELTISTPGTWKNLGVHVNDNARTTTTTGRSRINGANGNMAVSIGSTQTGQFNDTTNEDSISDGDDVCYALITGTGTKIIGINSWMSEYETTTSIGILPCGDTNIGTSFTTNVSTTEFTRIFGRPSSTISTTSIISDYPMDRARRFTNLFISIDANTTDGTSTFRFHINDANGDLSINIPANTTGKFQNTSSFDDVIEDDLVNVSMTGGSGTGSISGSIFSLNTNEIPDAPVGGDDRSGVYFGTVSTDSILGGIPTGQDIDFRFPNSRPIFARNV